MKIKEFKTIASSVFITIKKMFEFKIKHKKYLLEKNFTDEKINEITDNFTVFLYDYEKNEKEKETFILETLLGFSFFHNHELFKKLQPKIDKNLNDILENLFTRDIFTVSLNDFSIEETIKSIELVKNNKINIICLYYALKKDKEDLVNILKERIDLTEEKTKKEIKEMLLSLIISYGKNIKSESNKRVIKELLENQKIDDLFESYNLSKKRIKNIDKFFNISLVNEMLNSNLKIDTQHLDDKLVIDVFLKDLNSENNFEVIKKLLSYKSEKNLRININKLKKKKLLGNDFFEKILNEIEKLDYSKSLKSKNVLINLFSEIENLELSNEIKNKSYETLKNFAIDGYFSEISDYKNFILNYPKELSIEEFVKILIHKNQGYVALTDHEIELKTKMNEKHPEYFDEIIHINLNDSFLKGMHKENDDFFNDLVRKHSEKMNDINCFKLFIERSNNDLLVCKYLNYYKEKHGIDKIKETIFTKISVLNEEDIGGLTLNWFIENNLINKIINNNESLINFGNPKKNFLAEYLIEKNYISPDFLIKSSLSSFISNDKLFKFVLNNFEIKEQTKQLICNSVFAINSEELAIEIIKKGITPNDYYQEKFKTSPNNASNILLKGVLKNKLENLENKEAKKEKRLKI